MKKIITILGCLFFFATSYGQESIVKVRNYSYSSRFEDRRCDEIVTLTAFTKDGGEHLLIRYNKGNFEEGSSADRDYTVPGIVERLELYLFANDARDQGVSTSCSKGRRVETNPPLRNTIAMNPCDNGRYDYYHNNSSDVNQDIEFDYEVIPVPVVDRTTVSDLAGFEDPINITASPDFNPIVYNWQYGIQTGTQEIICGVISITPLVFEYCTVPTFDWFELDVTNLQDATVILKDFLNEDIIGEKIYFRIQSCDQNASNIIDYRVRKSAPHIVSIETKDVSCYNSIDPNTGKGDGEIVITFDRPLDGDKDLFGFEVFDDDKNANVTNDDNIIVFNGSPDNPLQHTISELPGSTTFFTLKIIGQYNGIPYYTEADSHKEDFVINRPSPVEFDNDLQADATDVWCHGGDDGTITLVAKGGTQEVDNEYYEYLIKRENQSWDDPTVEWRPFSNKTTHTITELNTTTGIYKGIYHIQIRDKNECEARDINGTDSEGNPLLGPITVKIVEIKEPVDPLTIAIDLVNEPRAFGFEDGRIIAVIKGGTAKADNSYDYQWVDGNNAPVNTTIESFNADGDYTVTLHSIGTGTYKITARDANHGVAINKQGCIEVSDPYFLDQPDPLKVNIEILNEVSCNRENEYNNGEDSNDPFGEPDQFQDGALIAYVTGGVRFDKTTANAGECRANFMPYCYTWKKDVGGVWLDVNVNDSIVRNLSEGTFALNVEDKNGIVLGTYTPISTANGREYELVQAIDSLKYLPQPDKLEVSFTKTVISCAEGNDAMATAFVKGGTKPYTYRWSNGDRDTASIENLFAGTYILYVEDAKGCQLEGSVTIEQPNGLVIDPIVVKSPTCFEGSDGEIEVNITGGVKPYTYKWSTGGNSNKISGLTQGTYVLEIIDGKGCKAFDEMTLVDPDPIVVNMEEKRSICADQTLNLDITIDDTAATYSWSSDNGFTSSESTVELTEPGRYTATITSGFGCIGVGDIVVEVFDTLIDSDFLITTQAYTGEDVILVNVSEPMGERVEWTIPEGIDVISKTDEELILRFGEEGAYDIKLRSYQMDCYEDFTKTVLVQPAIETPGASTSQSEFIEEFIVYPNPNEGSFKAKVTLAEASNVTIKIIDLMSGKIVNERTENNSLDFLLDYSMSMSSGVYLILLETPNGSSQTLKLVFE